MQGKQESSSDGERINRDQMWLRIALIAAARSTCPRGKIGCIITSPDKTRILGMGYAGAPSDSPHCTEVGCSMERVRERYRCVRTVHAEVNAALRVPQSEKKRGLVAYSTHSPCWECLKVLNQVGVDKVYFILRYGDEFVERLADKGVEIELICLPEEEVFPEHE